MRVVFVEVDTELHPIAKVLLIGLISMVIHANGMRLRTNVKYMEIFPVKGITQQRKLVVGVVEEQRFHPCHQYPFHLHLYILYSQV